MNTGQSRLQKRSTRNELTGKIKAPRADFTFSGHTARKSNVMFEIIAHIPWDPTIVLLHFITLRILSFFVSDCTVAFPAAY